MSKASPMGLFEVLGKLLKIDCHRIDAFALRPGVWRISSEGYGNGRMWFTLNGEELPDEQTTRQYEFKSQATTIARVEAVIRLDKPTMVCYHKEPGMYVRQRGALYVS